MNRVFKALADPTRRRVLQILRDGPQSAGDLADHFPVSKPTMSAHFAVLQDADLIEADKQGRTIVYRLKLSVVEDALLGFAGTLGWKTGRPAAAGSASKRSRPFRSAKGEA